MDQAARAAFKAFEHKGWEQLADSYYEVSHASTAKAAEDLLNAVGLGEGEAQGMSLLDVATGPGYSAGLAAARGASATGIDFAAAMAAKAATLFPAATFRQGDAEALPFPDASFDAVTCAFGLLHFANPDQAMREAAMPLPFGARRKKWKPSKSSVLPWLNTATLTYRYLKPRRCSASLRRLRPSAACKPQVSPRPPRAA